jgi:hypothetical protein
MVYQGTLYQEDVKFEVKNAPVVKTTAAQRQQPAADVGTA